VQLFYMSLMTNDVNRLWSIWNLVYCIVNGVKGYNKLSAFGKGIVTHNDEGNGFNIYINVSVYYNLKYL